MKGPAAQPKLAARLPPLELEDAEVRDIAARLRRVGGPVLDACRNLVDDHGLGLVVEQEVEGAAPSWRVHPWKIYAIGASVARAQADSLACLAEAWFMLGRMGMQQATRRQVERDKSRAAKTSAARPRSRTRADGTALSAITDEALREALKQHAELQLPERGKQKWLAAHFECDRKTIKERLDALINLRE